MSPTSWSNGAASHRDSKAQVLLSIERDSGLAWSRSGAVKSEPTDYDDVNRELTYASSPRSRHQRPPTVQVLPKPFSSPRPTTAISGSYNTFTYNSQDVHPLPVNVSSAPNTIPNQTTRANVSTTRVHTEAPRFRSSPSSPNHVPINHSSEPRPRTATQVFHNTSDLAAHYGIPTFLPPAPRTIPRRESHHTDLAESDFQSICSNYLNMLSSNPDTASTEDTAMAASVPTLDQEFPPAQKQQEAVQELMDVFQGDSLSTCSCSACASPLTPLSPASPEFSFFNEEVMSDYLTSPLYDSTLDDELLATPALGTDDSGAGIYDSPLMGDDWTTGYNGSLFNDAPYNFPHDIMPTKPAPPTAAPVTVSPATMELNSLWSISPSTPALEADTSPLPPPRPLPRRKSGATGTRKNVTPETLVPLDAPTQPRKYATPSATSRKEVPAVFARKRARSQAFGEEQDELEEEVPLPPNPTEADLIEAKRRQNTIAARRSRKRKLEYQRELEDSLDAMKEERDTWKNRALTYQALLKSHGIDAPAL
ncbi:hypothetical protein HWV62_39720 [Athelia sp. TMB]|nr:hypothetical protein HWV62_39720 [Athelia sp. TMB]